MLSRIAWALAIVAAGMAGWFVMLFAIPGLCSDMTWGVMLKRGSHINELRQPRVRFAPTDLVPLDNADTVTRSVIYDLGKGPLLFETQVPANLAYWSVSVFARNTDTIYIANDRKLGPGPFRLVVREADQAADDSGATQVVSPSKRGFLLVRAVMKDRNDPADVATTIAAVTHSSATVLPDK